MVTVRQDIWRGLFGLQFRTTALLTLVVFAATGLTCSYRASIFPVFSSVLRSAARLSVPPEFTVADGNVFLASGLGKESDRGAQPYAFVVAFGREDAGVRLSVSVSLPVSRLSPIKQ